MPMPELAPAVERPRLINREEQIAGQNTDFAGRILLFMFMHGLYKIVDRHTDDEYVLFAFRMLRLWLPFTPEVIKVTKQAYSSISSLWRETPQENRVRNNDPDDAHLPAHIREGIQEARCMKFFFMAMGMMAATLLFLIGPPEGNNREIFRPRNGF